nr:MAG TPA: RimK-related lysine biosynthesis protein, Probable-dependent amine/thiol ligase family Amino-group [Microviridae sp.]
MFKVPTAFKRFVSDGLDRCEYCQCVLFHVDDSSSVCLNCGAYFTSSNFKPTSLFTDTCSATSRGKDDHEI